MRYLGLLLLLCSSGLGCMDPKPNYDECVDIETARCEARDSCVGGKKFDKEYPDFDVETCIAYAKEHCRTRKIGGEGWDEDDVKACVDAIKQINKKNQRCGELMPRGVDETEDLDACEFIEAPDDEDGKRSDGGPRESDTSDTGASDTDPLDMPSDLFDFDAGIEIPL